MSSIVANPLVHSDRALNVPVDSSSMKENNHEIETAWEGKMCNHETKSKLLVKANNNLLVSTAISGKSF